jgi:dethiobiotin synthetase/adenosylmethionine--8-amino-7-oxononanoate aminotransferase
VALQADLFRPLRLPGLLVGGGELGGIHNVVSAAESLVSRGYDLAAVVLLQPPCDQLENHTAIKDALERW